MTKHLFHATTILLQLNNASYKCKQDKDMLLSLSLWQGSLHALEEEEI